MAMGRVAESAAESKRAVELDPIGTTLTSCLCWHSFAARQYDDAVRLATQYLTSQPNNAWEHTILGWTYEQKRMPIRRLRSLKRRSARPGDVLSTFPRSGTPMPWLGAEAMPTRCSKLCLNGLTSPTFQHSTLP